MGTERARVVLTASRACLRGAVLLVGLLLGAALPAQPVGDREMQVEAAFLVNFVRYAEWPRQRFAGPSDPYVIAVVGSRAASDTVAAVAGAAGMIQGRRIEVRHVDLRGGGEQRRRAAERLRASHLVFLPAAADARPRELLRALDGASVLTVSDVPGFAGEGGMLGLVRSGPRLLFEANPEAIQASGVSLSAKVLKLARIRGEQR